MADRAALEAVHRGLWRADDGLWFAPIRHHSPACAWAVRELIREVQPERVLIEAPVDHTPLIDLLLDPRTRPPVAIAAMRREAKGVPRLAAYYPYCDHSPEYVALREGRAIDAQLQFIDLPAASKLDLSMRDEDAPNVLTPVGVDEHYFDSGQFVAGLCRDTGCRDGYELWDHLFESRLGEEDWRGLLSDIGAYCAGLRAATQTQEIDARGDTARESHMLAAVREARDQAQRTLIVVGGFHVPALLDGLDDEPAASPAAANEAPVSDAYLVRYGFRALDALNGYGAGLPQPGYYDYLWQRANRTEANPTPWQDVALDLLSQFASKMREAGYPISVPAQVEMLRLAQGLASMRGRAGPGRHDLIDAARSALVKGEASGTEAWTGRLLAFLCGDALGDIPASAGSPPLVEDVRQRAKALRIDISDGARRQRSLDIRRKPTHLKASRLFHAMSLLETGFGDRQAGPDFAQGINVQRLFEEWSYAWSPRVEGRLIELSVLGDALPSTCVALLERHRADLINEGHSRDIGTLAGYFVQGVLAGLDDALEPFLSALAQDIRGHGDFDQVVAALRRLLYVAEASGPLEIPDDLPVDEVLQAAYQRLVYLCDDLHKVPQDRVDPCLDALKLVVELMAAPGGERFEQEPFDDAIDRVADRHPPAPLLGAVLGICVLGRRREAAQLCSALTGAMRGTVDAVEDRIGVLRGLLKAVPELLWRDTTILGAVDDMLCGLSADEFVDLLPHLRLAFTTLNPREADRLALILAERFGGRAGEFSATTSVVSEADLQRGLALERSLRQDLATDGLDSWIEADP